MKSETSSAERPMLVPLLTLIAVLAFITSCGQVVTGRPTPGMSPVALDKLNYGPYQREPAVYEPDLFGPSRVYLIEGHRLLGYVVSPHDIDPEIRHLQATVFTGGFPGFRTLEKVTDTDDFIVGASTTRTNDSIRNPKHMAISLLQYRTEESARHAADAYNSAVHTEFPGRLPLTVDGYRDARSSTSPDHTLGTAFIPQGTYVVAVVLRVPPAEGPQLSRKIKKALDLQLAAMADLTPTPGEEILDSPLDPGGIMRMTLQPLPTESAGATGVFTAAAHSHFEPDAAQFPDEYAAFGVDLVAKNFATVYRTADLSKALALQTALTQPSDDVQSIAGVPGIPDARCVHRPGAPYSTPPYTYACVLVYDRYVAMVGSTGVADIPDPELYQRAASQYTLMARS